MEETVKKINAKAPYIPANRIAMKSPPVQQKVRPPDTLHTDILILMKS